jgi:DNA-binding transcriptional ArsR family regulator
MLENPDLATIGALIGQPARAAMLLALLDGRARTATELADIAETSRPTASFHLAQLIAGGFVQVERQGRHRYARLTRPEIAELLESLLVVAEAPSATARRFGPHSSPIRQARMCYDHVAGALGVGLAESLVRRGALVELPGAFQVTGDGERVLAELGIDLAATRRQRRHFARPCIDWSERRPHLAGALGAALADRLLALGWIEREPEGRTLWITPAGQRGFPAAFGVTLDATDA